MELRQMERMARKYGAQMGEGIDGASKALRPYAKQARKSMRSLGRELRPLAKQASALVRKYPGGTLACALFVGYLLARR